jgi:hypothetical protein
MRNLFAEFRQLLQPGALTVATVLEAQEGSAMLELPGGGRIRARGQASVGSKVYVQDGVIQGPAPELPLIVDTV